MSLRRHVLLAVCLALVPATMWAGTAVAAPGGNSANAKLCQKGGWKALYTSQGAPFANQGACVSYGAKGGRITTAPPPPPTSAGERLCAASGGVFQAGTPASQLVWSCTGLSRSVVSEIAFNLALGEACAQDGGGGTGVVPVEGTADFLAYCRSEDLPT